MYLQKGLHRHTVVTIRFCTYLICRLDVKNYVFTVVKFFIISPQLWNFWIHEYWFLCYLAQENSSQNYLISRYVNLGINIKVNFRQISFCVVNYTISYAFGIYTGGLLKIEDLPDLKVSLNMIEWTGSIHVMHIIRFVLLG